MICLASLLMMAPQAWAQYDHSAENTLRIASYNILNGHKIDRTTVNYLGQEQIIAGLQPDVIAIEEVDSMTARSEGHFVLGEYASWLGMHGYYSPAIDFDGGKYGMGILTRERPLSVKRISLPGREEERTCVIAEFPRYVFCGTHLSLTEADRLTSLDMICSEAERYNKPFFLAGDLNCTPGSEAGKLLASRFILLTDTARHTFPADKPSETLDYVALYRNAAARDIVKLSSGVVDAPDASDHRPVYADVRFPLKAAELFVGEPYLQDLTADGLTVMYQTNAPVSTWVEYGTDTLHLQRARTLLAGQEPCLGIENSIRLEKLQPGQRYYYRVCAREVLQNHAYHKILGETIRTPFHQFTLPTSETTDFTALIMNDLHENDKLMRRLMEVVREQGITRYDFVVYNGDCVPDPHGEARTIGRVNVLMTGADAADHPTWLVRGNHEIRNSFSAGLVRLTRNFDGRTYGAFSWGDTRFVVLDCGEDKPDSTAVYYGLNDFSQLRADQVEFLKEELHSKAYRKASRHILINHIPIWGDSNVYTENYHPWTAMWEELLREGKFDLNLVAHAHHYYFFEKGAKGNPMPQYGGGGPSLDEEELGTIAVLQKQGKSLRLRVFDAKGRTRLDRAL